LLVIPNVERFAVIFGVSKIKGTRKELAGTFQPSGR
jgi:hypothetical protein